MPGAARALDTAEPTTAEDGGPAARSEAGAGLRSPDVIIDNQAALRLGDPGPGWQAKGGSTGVFIDGLPALRVGDATLHGSSKGELVQGSPDVIIGDRKPGTPKPRPHDTSVTLHVTDALGRPVHAVAVSALCPHEQRPTETIDASTSMGGLCRAATVTVDKALQKGTWDEGASRGAHPAAGGSGSPAVVHAPAPSASPSGGASVRLLKAAGPTHVVLPTTHNWVELVYEAFGHHLPTGPKQLALLGVRGASLAPAVPTAKSPEDTLEAEAAAGELTDVEFTTRAHVATAYGDLLFCVWTDASVHHTVFVEVFECTIDDSPGQGPLHLPFLLEGKLFHAEPGPFGKGYPGDDVTLHVFAGAHEPVPPEQPSAEAVIALAMTQRGTTEEPPDSNLVKYGAWYGANGEPWCAMFVSWCFAHVGMPLIRYAYCPYGIDDFKSGSFGTWLDGYQADAEPGDIVFYQFDGPGTVSDHTGIVVQNDGSFITTLEGNTTAPGGSGSQSNGGGVFLKTREKNDLDRRLRPPEVPEARGGARLVHSLGERGPDDWPHRERRLDPAPPPLFPDRARPASPRPDRDPLPALHGHLQSGEQQAGDPLPDRLEPLRRELCGLGGLAGCASDFDAGAQQRREPPWPGVPRGLPRPLSPLVHERGLRRRGAEARPRDARPESRRDRARRSRGEPGEGNVRRGGRSVS